MEVVEVVEVVETVQPEEARVLLEAGVALLLDARVQAAAASIKQAVLDLPRSARLAAARARPSRTCRSLSPADMRMQRRAVLYRSPLAAGYSAADRPCRD